MPRFAAIGLDHRHVYDLTQDLLDAGAECVGYNPDTTDPRVLAGFRKRFPQVPSPKRSACSTIHRSTSSSSPHGLATARIWRLQRCSVAKT